MKSLQILLLLTPVACLLAQTPPPSKTITLAPPPGQPAADKPPTVTLSQEDAPPPAPSTKNVPPDKVVLTIGDEKITAAEFNAFLEMVPEQYRKQMATGPGRRQFADNIVRLKLMAQEARKRKLDETPAFKEQLTFQTEQVLAQALVKNLSVTVKVDDAAAHDYYDKHKTEYEELKARHILVRAKGSPIPVKAGQKELSDEEALAKAKELRKKLVDGADFATLAKAESDDTGSAAKGGDLGQFGHGRMVPPFEKAAFEMKVGEISEPVKSQFGYHIIRVDEKVDKTFDQARPEIEKKLNGEAVNKAMEQLRTSANVVMDPDYFGPATAPVMPGKPPAGAKMIPAPAQPAPTAK